MNTIQQAREFGQEFWLDTIRRGLLKSGELRRLVDLGVSGLTANPTILEKAIVESDDYDDALAVLAQTARTPVEIYETLAIEDIQAAADLFRPVFEQTRGAWGFACLEISPFLAADTEGSIAEGRRLFKALDRPNVMVKIPATPAGIPVIRRLTAEGINVNVTLIFSLAVYREVAEAYITGLEDFVRQGGKVEKVASVASFFLSRIDTAVDRLLTEPTAKGEKGLADLAGTAATASAKLAYRSFKEIFYGRRFAGLREQGARVQRPLWASTGTKNPLYSDVKYVEPLIGKDTVNTLPLATIEAFLDHGRAENSLERGVEQAQRDLAALAAHGVGLDEVTARLLAEGVAAFSDSFTKLLDSIAQKKSRLAAARP